MLFEYKVLVDFLAQDEENHNQCNAGIKTEKRKNH